MNTGKVTINGKEFEARELTLENYPECWQAFTGLTSSDKSVVRDSFYVVLEKCTDANEEDRKKCTLREMLAASKVILEINGLSLGGDEAKKAETETGPDATVSEKQ